MGQPMALFFDARRSHGWRYLQPLISHVQRHLLSVFLEAVGVVISPCIAAPEVQNAVVAAAVVSGVAVVVVEPEDFFVLDLSVSEPGVVFVAVVFAVPLFVADVSEPPAFVDIVLAFDISVPVSVVVVEVDSSGRPRFFAFPNIDCHSKSSSSVEVVY